MLKQDSNVADTNGIKFSFEVPDTDRFEVGMFGVAATELHCIRIGIEEMDYKYVAHMAEMQICCMQNLINWSKHRMENKNENLSDT